MPPLKQAWRGLATALALMGDAIGTRPAAWGARRCARPITGDQPCVAGATRSGEVVARERQQADAGFRDQGLGARRAGARGDTDDVVAAAHGCGGRRRRLAVPAQVRHGHRVHG